MGTTKRYNQVIQFTMQTPAANVGINHLIYTDFLTPSKTFKNRFKNRMMSFNPIQNWIYPKNMLLYWFHYIQKGTGKFKFPSCEKQFWLDSYDTQKILSVVVYINNLWVVSCLHKHKCTSAVLYIIIVCHTHIWISLDVLVYINLSLRSRLDAGNCNWYITI